MMRICDANLQMKCESTDMRMRKRDKWRYIEISGDWEVENQCKEQYKSCVKVNKVPLSC